MRYAGIAHSRIQLVSDSLFTHPTLTVVPIPDAISVASGELMASYRWNNVFYKLGDKREIKDLKIAVITTFKEMCGISTYAENLLPHILPHCKEFKLFIEENDSPTGDILTLGNEKMKPEQVITCWKRGKSMLELAKKIREFSPDLLLINHEFGLYPRGDYWLSLTTQLSEFRTIVIQHSVFKHRDKTIVEAAMQEIVVHLDRAKEWLIEKGISSPIHVLPHGCYDLCEKPKLWNYYKTPHTILTSGFGHSYKGFETLIDAVGVLKRTYADVFLTILFSEDKKNSSFHDAYYFSLLDQITKLGLEDNVGIIRGFQSEEVLESFYLTNQVAVFPYRAAQGHEVSGSSGMSRFALKYPLPVMTSEIPHFEDMPTLKVSTSEEFAARIAELFESEELRAKQVSIQQEFVKKNSWTNVAKQFIELIENP